jgi:hypothetical protein
MSADVLLQEICDERGGQDGMTVLQLAAARNLAKLLSDDAADPAAVARSIPLLESVLPLKSAEPTADLSKLSDAQFSQLERLLAIARGQTPPRSIPRKPPPKPLTPRGYRAAELANLLDRVENEGRALANDDLLQARNCLSSIMFPLGTLERLLPAEVFAAPTPSPEAASPTPEPEQKAPPPTPAPPDNVVPQPFTAIRALNAIQEMVHEDDENEKQNQKC